MFANVTCKCKFTFFAPITTVVAAATPDGRATLTTKYWPVFVRCAEHYSLYMKVPASDEPHFIAEVKCPSQMGASLVLAQATIHNRQLDRLRASGDYGLYDLFTKEAQLREISVRLHASDLFAIFTEQM